MEDCEICFIEHQDEIHASTLRIRSWFRSELKRKLIRLEDAISGSEEAIPQEQEEKAA